MNDPHDREYLAAVSYLPEHTVSSGITTNCNIRSASSVGVKCNPSKCYIIVSSSIKV